MCTTLETSLYFFNVWNDEMTFAIHQCSAIPQNCNDQRILCKTSTLHACTHLYEASGYAKIYTLGELTTQVSGYKTTQKTAGEHKAAQDRLKKRLDVLEAYQLICMETFATSMHGTVQYRITATSRLVDIFDRFYNDYQQAA